MLGECKRCCEIELVTGQGQLGKDQQADIFCGGQLDHAQVFGEVRRDVPAEGDGLSSSQRAPEVHDQLAEIAHSAAGTKSSRLAFDGTAPAPMSGIRAAFAKPRQRVGLSGRAASCEAPQVLLALPAVFHALAALTDAVAIRINYEAPASCPNQDAFYDSVRARTDRVRKAQGNEPRVDVNVRVTRGDHGFHGEMREVVNQSETSARSVEGETCKEVTQALAFTVALSFDPEAHQPLSPEATPPTKPPAPVAPAVTPAAVQPQTAQPAPPAASPQLELELGLSAFGTVVETAGFATGGALSAMFVRKTNDSTSSALQLSLMLAGTGLLTAPDDHRTNFGALALDACPFRHHTGSWEFAPCALATIGFLELTGRDVGEPETVDRAWWSAGVDFQVAVLLGEGVVFESALAATVPLVRHRYYTSSPEQVVTETPVISPLLRVGLGYRF